MENIEIKNKSPPFDIFFGKSFSKIKDWKIDKATVNDKNRITKIEVYNYFNLNDLDKLLKYLNTKKFKYTKDTKKFPRLWNIILNQEGKHIISKGKIVDISKGNYTYYYSVILSRVIVHRGRPILIKVYWNESMKKSFFKLELTYSYFHGTYNLHYLDWLYALKSINEIVKKLEIKVKPIGFSEDFSGKITFNSFIFQIMGLMGPSTVNHINTIFSLLTKTQ